MGAILPKQVRESVLLRKLKDAGLKLVHQGKVRDTFELPGDLLLQVASYRVSIFDLVLPRLVEKKADVLTAMTVFWLTQVLHDFESHLVAFGAGIDEHLPEALRGDPKLQAQALVVRRLEILPVECIVRGHLTGSGWRDYDEKNGEVCGHRLPEGLHDGSKLDQSIFTPSTKEDQGHDVNISAASVREEFGDWLEELSLAVFETARSFAASRGIIIADTKFEFGEGGVIADEVLTPDSSRYWDRQEWESCLEQRKSPPGFDKEPIRQAGRAIETPFGLGLNSKLDMRNPDHLHYIENDLKFPGDVLTEASGRYREIMLRLTGSSLEWFQHNEMRIRKQDG